MRRLSLFIHVLTRYNTPTSVPLITRTGLVPGLSQPHNKSVDIARLGFDSF